MTSTQKSALYWRISVRVAPPLVLLYFVSFLDRVNISFAAVTMNRDLGFSDDLYGLAAGIFFVGYLLFAVPSNLMLTRFGARRWIAVLMVLWGLLSAGMAFVKVAPVYIALRLLIGAAEAGFFPGVILYLTQWLPGSARAGILSLFMFAVPLSSVVGAPISARIMRMGGYAGLHGWQWLFLLEALPAVVLGCAVPWMLQPGPREVAWLSAEEKTALLGAIAEESAAPAERSERLPIGPLVAPIATYFAYTVGLYALGFWVPRLLSSYGVTLVWLGWLTAVPFAVGSVTMLVWCRWSDRTGERRLNLTASLIAGAAGMAMTALAPNAWTAIVGLSVAAGGIFTTLPVFWAAFSQGIEPRHAAVGIAAVNSVGNLGGFLGPYATGWLLRVTHGYSAGLFATGLCLVCGAGLAFGAMKIPRRRGAGA